MYIAPLPDCRPCESTPPVARILITSTPYFSWARTTWRTWSTAVGDAEVTLLGKHHDASLRREVIQIAMAARNGNCGTAGHDAGADQITFVDGVAQVDRQKRV